MHHTDPRLPPADCRRQPPRGGHAPQTLGGTARLAVCAICCGALSHCSEPKSFDAASLEVKAEANALPSRASVRAVYSGHSLSEDLPALVDAMAQRAGATFYFEEHNQVGSTIQERLGASWRPERDHFDVAVVTERHDLLYTLFHEATLPSLHRLVDQLKPDNPALQLLVYQGWLEIDFDDPMAFVHFEEQHLVAWECAVSAFNEDRANSPQYNPALVLPGGWALGQLLERIVRQDEPSLQGTPQQRVRSLFRDSVHLSPEGKHFMAAFHYASLFHQPAVPTATVGVPSARSAYLCREAWKLARQYALRARGAAARPMKVCRQFLADVLVPAFTRHPRDGHGAGWLRRWKQTFDFQRSINDATSATNPFRQRR